MQTFISDLIFLLIAAAIVYAISNDKKHEEAPNTKYLDDEWEDVIPDCGQPERPFSIELLSSKNYPVMQKLESFSKN